jgi:hypothetical protein
MDTDSLGVALIVGGLAFLCGGLVFLLPVGRKASQDDSIEHDRESVDHGLQASRRERGDLS